MSIVDTPENGVSNVDRELDKRKICTSSINSSSTLFSCSIRAMYNKVHCSQKKNLMLKLYIPEINTSILPNNHYENIFSEKLVNQLYAWIENHPHVIHSPNVKDSFFFKINGTLVKKKTYTSNLSTRATQLYDITNF